MVKKENNENKYSDLLLQVNNDLAVSKTLDDALDILINISSSVLGAERGTAFINDRETHELYSRVAQGNLKREIRFMNNKGIAGWVFTHKKGAIVHEAYKDERFNKSVDMRTGYRTKSILCAPLKTVRGDIIGVTQLLNRINSKFSKKDLNMLELISKQAAIAIQSHINNELKEKEKEKEIHFQSLISEVSTEISLSKFIKKMFTVISDLLDCERATLFMNDEKTNELYVEVGTGIKNREIRFPNDMGIAGYVFTSGELVNLPHPYADLRFNPSVDKSTGFFTRNMLTVPLINKEGKTLGVCQALNKKGGHFTDYDISRLFTFSSQVCIGIENAYLFENVQELMNYNENMLNSMSNGVITINEDGLIEKCNPACLRLMNVDNEEIIIHQTIQSVLKRKNKWLSDKLKDVQADEYVPDVELDFNGEKISANLTIMPLTGKDKQPLGSILMIEDVSGEKRMKSTMSRYMDANLAEELLENKDNVLGGNEGIGTVFFSDIRSFTTISENLGVKGTVEMLNEYFSIMVECIQNEDGMLDKFIGDAIMAVFGTPIAHKDDPDRGVRSAIQMMLELKKYNEKRINQGLIEIDHGMGLNTGQIVSGNIGSEKRMDYTVIGDAVNLAARMESSCKRYGAHILISDITFKALKDTYRSRQVDKLIVKGKTVPAGVYEILDYHSNESFPNMIEVLEMFNNGIEYYNNGRWDDAIKQFNKAKKGNPKDKCSNMYIERCEMLKKKDPKEWDGIWEAQSK